MFTFAKDVRFTDEKQFSILNLIQDSETGYISEYSILESVGRNLGSYDYLVTSDGWDLTFNPALFEFNNYNTSVISFSALSDYSGIGSVHAIGTAVSTFSEQHSVPTGTATTIATIPTTFRSAKVLVMLEDSNDNYIGNELNIIHDGTDVSILNMEILQIHQHQILLDLEHLMQHSWVETCNCQLHIQCLINTYSKYSDSFNF